MPKTKNLLDKDGLLTCLYRAVFMSSITIALSILKLLFLGKPPQKLAGRLLMSTLTMWPNARLGTARSLQIFVTLNGFKAAGLITQSSIDRFYPVYSNTPLRPLYEYTSKGLWFIPEEVDEILLQILLGMNEIRQRDYFEHRGSNSIGNGGTGLLEKDGTCISNGLQFTLADLDYQYRVLTTFPSGAQLIEFIIKRTLEA